MTLHCDISHVAYRGGIELEHLERLDECWFKHSHLKGVLKCDHVFKSGVISPELFAKTEYFYRRQNLCVFGQLVGHLRNELTEKLKRMAGRNAMFDMAAAMCPLDLLQHIFSIPPGQDERIIARRLENPLTMIGLRGAPWRFDMKLLPYFAMNYNTDIVVVDMPPDQVEKVKARRKAKKRAREAQKPPVTKTDKGCSHQS